MIRFRGTKPARLSRLLSDSRLFSDPRRTLQALTWRLDSAGSIRTIRRFPMFAPNAAGPPRPLASITVEAINETFPLLAALGPLPESLASPPSVETLTAEDRASKEAGGALATLFERYGSDKSTVHNYEHLYGYLLREPDSITALLEIGIGTNDRSGVSNMGRDGRPGASLRAFRDYLPRARVFGADIDTSTLFVEERIQTFYVDQTEQSSLERLGAQVDIELDLIIDDGLHAPHANIAALTFAIGRLKPGGAFVVEDIPSVQLPIWQVVAKVLSPEYTLRIFGTQVGLAVLVQRGR